MTANQLTVADAFGVVNCAKFLRTNFPADMLPVLEDAQQIVNKHEARMERSRLRQQAWNAAFHEDPDMRRYARLERRLESATGSEAEAVRAELDDLGESIFCALHDC